jgi:hypothetical protein
MTGAGCCALAVSGHARVEPAASAMNSRRFLENSERNIARTLTDAGQSKVHISKPADNIG